MKVINYKNLKFIKDNIFIIMFVVLGIFLFTVIMGINIFEYFKNYKEGIQGIDNDQKKIMNVSVNGQEYDSSNIRLSGSSDSSGNTVPSGNNYTDIPHTEPSIYVGPSGDTGNSRIPKPYGPSYYNIYNIYSGSIGPTGPAGPPGNSDNNMSVYLNFKKEYTNGTKLANLYNGNKNYNVTMVGNPEIIVDPSFNLGILSLNGTSSYLTIDNFSVTSNGFSTSFLCKNKGSGWARIFDFGNGSPTDNIVFSVENGASVYNTKNVYQPYDAERKINTNFPWKINDGTWKHVVWTCTYAPQDSYTSIWHIYINNKLVYTTYKGLYPTTLTNRTKNYIGKSNWSGEMYNGLLADFRIYNEVLNIDDINTLYNNNTEFIKNNKK
jgi:hypothetical protein